MNALGRQQNGERLSDPTLERKSGDIPQESNEEHRTMINRKGLCDCANKCLETKNQVGRCETTDIKSCGGSVSGLCECRDTADKELDKRRDRREAQLANINRSAIVIMPLDHSRPVKTALESAEEIGTAAAPARRAARTDRPVRFPFSPGCISLTDNSTSIMSSEVSGWTTKNALLSPRSRPLVTHPTGWMAILL